ncbi:bifunctional dTDP-4-dehydrorhamnose 3,5-epimerase family protein/NAD(P)-dependent oxidoreductase [Corynebacterium casei]|uniref:bifunctional dTDP-4-dehydrorhamnose 3,5-epimerase family protein/NAD(P)-dependent oxidoreductase n=1 Tax=Corynebacterium casei TaxID=160386 RepID=UPI002647DF66|nr:bifunctional dTDP-4-dehydrorhamnose 3,5-epimerase family protein/NAD(P)-dependent oxidoreductase [Corynebacterium casei]MDN5707110.1 bifunctional dTDP-4-dehydrorhamnose 3,5-epimerase family protein/NAD(P)-dependent oxidoreductase [Corynebacterium casei]
MHIESTEIDGLLIVHLDVHGDNRGWFKENWQRERMVEAGLPDFGVVQHNFSFNASAGVTRGLHAEPWDKLVSVAHGKVYGAWCDLREGSATYGQLVSTEIGPETAVFVPRGVANGFQALEDDTVYSYLVSDHWSPDAQYTAVNLDMVDWPLEPTEISDKDRLHPQLAEVLPMPPRKILVTGADGQLGRALRTAYKNAAHVEFATRADFDITAEDIATARPWRQYEAIINCAAYNDVNGAETDRAGAWAVNATAPARLAAVAAENNLTLVHVSSDYIFDGTRDIHSEEELASPLSAYGASKAAGDTAAQTAPRHYVIRTAWVFGEGNNFMSTMASLASRNIEPLVINDQRGRPTYAEDLAKGIKHLLDTGADYGVYNLTSGGDAVTRDEIAMAVFIGMGHDPAEVHSVSSEQYNTYRAQQAEKNGQPAPAVEAPRPAESTLDLSKIEATGFKTSNWRSSLALYLALLES